MKRLLIIAFSAGVIASGCGGVQREPSAAYIPDMAYSRAMETYAAHNDSFTTDARDAGMKIFYSSLPVNGTVARGQEMPFHIAKDKPGDTANYVASKAVANPIKTMSEGEMKEAERLYIIQCGICHGAKLDGNGPLYNDGKGKFPAAPRNLLDAYTKAMPDGQMFYSITYGKNTMGPYGAQLNRKQRWMIVNYIRNKQGVTTAGTTTAAAGADSTSAGSTK